MIQFRHAGYAAVAAAWLASAGVAQAQTTKAITRAPLETRTVVTGAPLQLPPVQRATIYRTIIRAPAPPPPAVADRVSTPVPPDVEP